MRNLYPLPAKVAAVLFALVFINKICVLPQTFIENVVIVFELCAVLWYITGPPPTAIWGGSAGAEKTVWWIGARKADTHSFIGLKQEERVKLTLSTLGVPRSV